MMELLNKDRTSSRESLPTEGAAALLSDEWSEASAAVLRQLHERGLWLKCECGTIYHVREGRVLVRNRTQEQPQHGDRVCELCLAHPGRDAESRQTTIVVDDLKDIPVMRVVRRRRGSIRNVQPGGLQTVRRKRLSALARLQRIVTLAAFPSLRHPLPAAEIWSRVLRVLRRHPLDPSDVDGLTQADLAWTPMAADSPEAVLRRMAGRWEMATRNPQVWVFGLVLERPSGTELLKTIEVPWRDSCVTVQVPARRCTRAGQKGPWLVLAMARIGATGQLEFVQAGLQAIAACGNPVPVESDYERQVVGLLQEEEYAFWKPMPADWMPDRPDFILSQHLVLIEVQGRKDEEYRLRKHRIHLRMLENPEYRAWTLIRWDATSQPLSHLRELLRNRWDRPDDAPTNRSGSWRRRG